MTFARLHRRAVSLQHNGFAGGFGRGTLDPRTPSQLKEIADPYATHASGNPKYSSAMYEHMAFKKYVDLVTEDFHSTRMDNNLTSVIDHVLVNVSAKNHIPTDKATIFLPGASSTFATWRETFSDHFPISFELTIESGDDDVDF